MTDTHPLFLPAVFVGGLVFGVGLAVGQMARPEVVLAFLQLEDLGLALVMGSAVAVVAFAYAVVDRVGGRPSLRAGTYGRRLKSFGRNVPVGGVVFGVGWGLSGICPGAAYASVGIGNLPILWGIAGMFAGAYLQGWGREALARYRSTERDPAPEVSD